MNTEKSPNKKLSSSCRLDVTPETFGWQGAFLRFFFDFSSF
jgi:hypothetical protein